MNEDDKHYTFIKCAIRFITGIDEEELDWQLRTHQCYFDDSGPCCSDSTLLEVFREATFNKADESELYAVIEKICMCYCDEIKSARSFTKIIIPEGATTIEPYAFRGFAALASITIPKSVTEIGHEAFRGCTSLTSIVIPEGVTKIGEAAFLRCTGLKSIVIPKSVTTIGQYAFNFCSNLQEITVGAESQLENMKIPEGVKVIIAS